MIEPAGAVLRSFFTSDWATRRQKQMNNRENKKMNTLKLALAGLAAAGAALVVAPEPATAGHFGYGHPGFHRRVVVHRPFFHRRVVVRRPFYPVVYHRPFVRRVVVRRPYYPIVYDRPLVRRVVVRRPYYPIVYHRPFVRRVVVVRRPFYPVAYHRPFVRREVVHRPFFHRAGFVHHPRFVHRRAWW